MQLCQPNKVLSCVRHRYSFAPSYLVWLRSRRKASTSPSRHRSSQHSPLRPSARCACLVFYALPCSCCVAHSKSIQTTQSGVPDQHCYACLCTSPSSICTSASHVDYTPFFLFLVTLPTYVVAATHLCSYTMSLSPFIHTSMIATGD